MGVGRERERVMFVMTDTEVCQTIKVPRQLLENIWRRRETPSNLLSHSTRGIKNINSFGINKSF